MSEGWPNSMTLGEAREKLRALVEDGSHCPLCTQFAKVYKRKLPSASARVLIALYRQKDEWVFVPRLLELPSLRGTPHQGGYGTLSHHWGLIQQMEGERDDGSKRVGWWRLTDLGRAFVLHQATVPKYARLYGNRFLNLVGEPITISDALGNKFDYRELMGQ